MFPKLAKILLDITTGTGSQIGAQWETGWNWAFSRGEGGDQSGAGDGGDAPRNKDEALEHGLSIKDPQWPWRGSHTIEGHHPLLQGKSYKEFWGERGLTPKEVDGWVVDLDKDIHRAITESGWWDDQLFGRIAAEERIHGTLSKEEVKKIAKDLLDEIAGWGK